jgi:hypothetical protein
MFLALLIKYYTSVKMALQKNNWKMNGLFHHDFKPDSN